MGCVLSRKDKKITVDDQFSNGPDQILPSVQMSTCRADGAVRIRDSGGVGAPPISLPGKFMLTAKQYGNSNVMAFKQHPNDKEFKFITMSEYLVKTRAVARAFIELGLDRNRAVLILARNCPQWNIAFFAAVFAGGIGGGLYSTNSAETCFLSCMKVQPQILVVEDVEQAHKILEHRDKMPFIRAIVQIEGTPASADILTWGEVVRIGSCMPDNNLEQRLKKICINQCCLIVFTSGTTGAPKAVMINHDSINFNISMMLKSSGCSEHDRVVSFLPLSHVAGELYDLIGPICVKPYCVYFADKDALKGSLFRTFREVRPTLILAVPRIAEKIAELIKQLYLDNEKNDVYQWALMVAREKYHHYTEGKGFDPLSDIIARNLVFSKIKSALGFSELKSVVIGAASCSSEVKQWWLAADLIILESFGMSELSGGQLQNIADECVLDATGFPLPSVKAKIINPDEDGHGEVCFWSRTCFMGYLDDREKTAECMDQEGWVHSGDIGKIGPKGVFIITGRVKELIVTSGGENIAPVYIEENLKASLKCISQAVVVGEGRHYLAVLISLGCIVQPDSGLPTEQLNALALNWLGKLGLPYKTVGEVIESGPHPKIIESITHAMTVTNEKAISRAQKIHRFAILPTDLSVATGELGPTLKLRRHIIVDKYKNVIDEMYARAE